MKRVSLSICVYLAASLPCAMSNADGFVPPPKSVEEFAAQCTSQVTFNQTMCLQYLTAVRDSMAVTMSLLKAERQRGLTIDPVFYRSMFCIPDSVGVDDMHKTFKGWAEEHPEKSSLPLIIGLYEAMQSRWPCT